MVGKGKRRREKNYIAAHGGPTRLPPPPDPSKLDALPSKLRTIISFTSTLPGSAKDSKNNHDEKKNTRRGAEAKKERRPENESKTDLTGFADGSDDEELMPPHHPDSGGGIMQNDKNEKRKKKRKRKEVKDLRFETELGFHSKRKERKKKYLEEKKKKRKKAKTEENVDFPGPENIKFGEVVEAPPKLVAIPKALKIDASKERLRLQAIETYRNRKGWTSRPGLKLPPVSTSPSL